MARKHTSAKGVSFDMEGFVQNKSDEIAIGNMASNARGDVLGRGGKVEVKREKVIQSYYREEPQSTVTAPLSRSPIVETTKDKQKDEEPAIYLTRAEALAALEENNEVEDLPSTKPARKSRKTKE